MDQSKEQAFRTEATSIIKSAENVKNLISLEKLKVSDIAGSCSSATIMCFPIDSLINLGYHDGNKDNYDGTIYFKNSLNGSYVFSNLNLIKGIEYAIIDGTAKDYTKDTVELSAVSKWDKDKHPKCTCS